MAGNGRGQHDFDGKCGTTAVQRAVQTRKKRNKVPGERSPGMETPLFDQMMRNFKILSEKSEVKVAHITLRAGRGERKDSYSL